MTSPSKSGTNVSGSGTGGDTPFPSGVTVGVGAIVNSMVPFGKPPDPGGTVVMAVVGGLIGQNGLYVSHLGTLQGPPPVVG